MGTGLLWPLAGALLPLLPGSGGDSSERHCCRCLQMFADVLLAPGVGLATSEPRPRSACYWSWPQPGPVAQSSWGLQGLRWGVPTGAGAGCPQRGRGPGWERCELRAAGLDPGWMRSVSWRRSPFPPPTLGTSQRRVPLVGGQHPGGYAGAEAGSGSSPQLCREQLLLLLKIEAGATGGSGCPPSAPSSPPSRQDPAIGGDPSAALPACPCGQGLCWGAAGSRRGCAGPGSITQPGLLHARTAPGGLDPAGRPALTLGKGQPRWQLRSP